jgi:hypothetical protein
MKGEGQSQERQRRAAGPAGVAAQGAGWGWLVERLRPSHTQGQQCPAEARGKVGRLTQLAGGVLVQEASAGLLTFIFLLLRC